MQFFASCIITFLLPTQFSCDLYFGQDKWGDKINRNAVKCLDTFIATTDWAVDDFTVIFDDVETIEFDLFKRRDNYTWRFVNSKIDSSTLSGFSNVILFASSFESSNETASEIGVRPMDTRSKYVIVVTRNFGDFNDIRRASIGIGPAMWKLDKTRVVYLVPHNENILAMTYFPFVQDCEPGELEVLDEWREGGFQKKVELFPEKMLDVRGCVQNHTGLFTKRSALQGSKVITETGVLTLGGVGGKMIAVVAEKMNMKLHLLPVEPRKGFVTVKDMIVRGDAILCVFTNAPSIFYLNVLDVGSGYMQESFSFGYLTEGYEVSWKNLVLPLSPQVWLYTGYTFVIFCGLVLVANRLHRLNMIDFESLQLLDIFGAFLGGSRTSPRNIPGRYLFTIWIFYSYLITASYNCGLVSFLTTPNEKRVIDTLAELLEDGMDFGGTKDHRKIYNDPSDPVMIKIYDRFKIWSSDEAERIVESREGASGFLSSSRYVYNENRTDHNDRIHVLKERSSSFLVPITMRRGSPFTIGVRRYASQAMQGGFHTYWFNYYTRKSRLAEIDTEPPSQISIKHIRGILCLYIAASILSCLTLIGEIIFKKYSSNVSSSSVISLK